MSVLGDLKIDPLYEVLNFELFSIKTLWVYGPIKMKHYVDTNRGILLAF